MPHLPERGGGSGNDTRLSLGNGAIALPKISCFTGYCSAPSPRLRTPAPYKRQSSTGVQILGGARGTGLGMPKCTVIYVTFAIVCLTSSVVLRIPTEKRQTDREDSQKGRASHGVFDGSSQPPK